MPFLRLMMTPAAAPRSHQAQYIQAWLQDKRKGLTIVRVARSYFVGARCILYASLARYRGESSRGVREPRRARKQGAASHRSSALEGMAAFK